jgi:hypothetical protein
MTHLTELVLAYQRTGAGYEELRKRIEEWIYYYPTTRPGFGEEDSADFLLYFRSKIPTMLMRYVHSDRSFEAYLATTLRWQLRSYARMRRRKVRMHELTRAPEIWDDILGVAESPPPESRLATATTYRLAGAKIRNSPSTSVAKRVVILAMKAAPVIDDRQLVDISRLSGYPEDWLRRCRDELRELTTRREARRRELRERRNGAFFKIRVLQDELSWTSSEKRRTSLKAELERQKRRLTSARAKLARVPAVPTNGEIARTLGFPKGSIDSSLHYMKRNLRSLQKGKPLAENRGIR